MQYYVPLVLRSFAYLHYELILVFIFYLLREYFGVYQA
jgi:hypothetical protein